jgi:hypothetical protein
MSRREKAQIFFGEETSLTAKGPYCECSRNQILVRASKKVVRDMVAKYSHTIHRPHDPRTATVHLFRVHFDNIAEM